jgi:hypothetical protein
LLAFGVVVIVNVILDGLVIPKVGILNLRVTEFEIVQRFSKQAVGGS